MSVALKLFTEFGYSSVSTRRIAIKSDVSEGLLFKHFGNKAGLLFEIVSISLSIAGNQLRQLEEIKDPQERISALIDMADDSQHFVNLWSLQTISEHLHPELTDRFTREFSHPLQQTILTALKELNYSEVDSETALLYLTLRGMAVEFHTFYASQQTSIRRHLKGKFTHSRK